MALYAACGYEEQTISSTGTGAHWVAGSAGGTSELTNFHAGGGIWAWRYNPTATTMNHNLANFVAGKTQLAGV